MPITDYIRNSSTHTCKKFYLYKYVSLTQFELMKCNAYIFFRLFLLPHCSTVFDEKEENHENQINIFRNSLIFF